MSLKKIDETAHLRADVANLRSIIKQQKIEIENLRRSQHILRQSTTQMSEAAEMETEQIANVLLRRVGEAKREKLLLAQKLEQEEELLVNNLQRRFRSVLLEKADLAQKLSEAEAKLREEQQYVDHIRDETTRLKSERERAIQFLNAEQEYFTNHFQRFVYLLINNCASFERMQIYVNRSAHLNSIILMHINQACIPVGKGKRGYRRKTKTDII